MGCKNSKLAKDVVQTTKDIGHTVIDVIETVADVAEAVVTKDPAKIAEVVKDVKDVVDDGKKVAVDVKNVYDDIGEKLVQGVENAINKIVRRLSFTSLPINIAEEKPVAEPVKIEDVQVEAKSALIDPAIEDALTKTQQIVVAKQQIADKELENLTLKSQIAHLTAGHICTI